jgi:glutamate/tyrosine decarboxylase-like PLP-dependent enzyme
VRELLQEAARRAASYLEGLPTRSVPPTADSLAGLQKLRIPLPERSRSPKEVLALLDEIGSPATVASAGPRYFGFVTGGSVPASVACNLLASAWDQNGAFTIGSPINAALEEISLSWIRELLSLSRDWGGGFVTGTTMGNFSGLAAARHHLLAREGWNVEARGLFGAPEIRVVVGAEVHASLLKALSLLGLGRERVTTLPVDGRGRMRADALTSGLLEGPTIICLQAGNVNTGAVDPIADIAPRAREAGAWVHLDGAFGLWAAVSPRTRHLTGGLEKVDSIATDLHKWLNVPYDSGLALYRDPEVARRALAVTAAYLPQTDERTPSDFTPEASRRARGIDIWAALLSLGREGVIDLVDRCCRHARAFASGLKASGYDILNEVELNQVLVSFGDDAKTRAVVKAVQREGTCWCGATFWQGKAAMRISLCSWATTEEDVERSVEAIVRAARGVA